MRHGNQIFVKLVLPLALGAAGWLLVPEVASTCDCGAEIPLVGEALPADGATDVPTNALIWLRTDAPESVVLEQGGEAVDTELAFEVLQGLDGWRGLRPLQPLQPNTQYTVRGAVSGALDRTFTTADADAPSPDVPELQGRDHVSDPDGGPCDTVLNFLRLEVGDAESFTVVEIDGNSAVEESFVRGVAASSTGEVDVGALGCEASNWPGAAEGTESTARFGRVDVAGQFSGFGEPVSLQIDEPSGCNVSGDDPGRSGAVWLGLCVLVVGRRRRRSVAGS